MNVQCAHPSPLVSRPRIHTQPSYYLYRIVTGIIPSHGSSGTARQQASSPTSRSTSPSQSRPAPSQTRALFARAKTRRQRCVSLTRASLQDPRSCSVSSATRCARVKHTFISRRCRQAIVAVLYSATPSARLLPRTTTRPGCASATVRSSCTRTDRPAADGTRCCIRTSIRTSKSSRGKNYPSGLRCSGRAVARVSFSCPMAVRASTESSGTRTTPRGGRRSKQQSGTST